MNSLIDSFGETAQKLARNPLGIIALFIVLIYGFAALVISISGSNLTPDQRWPIIWFLVIFPVIVLFVFTWLVINHHMKLYAPSDYRNDENFLQMISPSDHVERLNKEIASDLENETLDPDESQITEEKSEDKIRNIRSEYIRAEGFVLRQLEVDLGTSIKRQVALGKDKDNVFDGIIIKGNVLTMIEIKLFRRSGFPNRSIEKIVTQAEIAKLLFSLKNQEMRLIIAIVIDFDETNNKMRDRISRLIGNPSIPVDVRYFKLSDLKQRFGVK